MRPRAKFLAAVAAAGAGATVLALAGGACAQTVDYAQLRELMGEPVTTSVTGSPQRASDAPASIVLITRDMIARSPARDVADLLKAYAGVDYNRYTAGQSDIGVRGSVQASNPALLVLVDGRQVYLDHYGYTDWQAIGVQLEDIEQIEFVKGPASALYGFNAAIGVVNIVTVNSLSGRRLAASATAGDHGQTRVAASGSLPLSATTALRLSAGHDAADEYAIPKSLLVVGGAGRDPTSDQVSGELVTDLFKAGRLRVGGDYSDVGKLQLLPFGVLSGQTYETRSGHVFFDRDTPWGAVSAKAYVNDLDLHVQGLSQRFTFDDLALHSRIVDAQLASVIKLPGDSTLRVGAEFRDETLAQPQSFSGDLGYQVGALDVVGATHLTPSLELTLAGRIDRLQLNLDGLPNAPSAFPTSAYDRSFVTGSFNAALLYRVGGGVIRLDGGRGVQAPSLFDFGLNLTLSPDLAPVPFPVKISGDPTLSPTYVYSGELVYSRPLSKMVKFDGALFYTRVDDAISFQLSPQSIIVRTSPAPLGEFLVGDIGGYDTYGLEATLSGILGAGLSWNLNYTYTGVEERTVNQGGLSAPLTPRASTPRNKVNLLLDYDHGPWFGSGLLRYTDRNAQVFANAYNQPQSDDVPAAVALDLKVGRRLLRGLSAVVDVENLTSADGANLSPVLADRRIRAGLEARF